MAFTDYETEQLRKALLKETRRCAVTLGMKKTSVDQLTKAVGIAKGSFYKFYESKEMLFFAVLENIHSELYGVADRALRESDGLPPSERAAKAAGGCEKHPLPRRRDAHPSAVGEARPCAKTWCALGCRHSARTDSDRFTQGANRRTVPAGAGNVSVRRLQGVI